MYFSNIFHTQGRLILKASSVIIVHLCRYREKKQEEEGEEEGQMEAERGVNNFPKDSTDFCRQS